MFSNESGLVLPQRDISHLTSYCETIFKTHEDEELRRLLNEQLVELSTTSHIEHIQNTYQEYQLNFKEHFRSTYNRAFYPISVQEVRKFQEKAFELFRDFFSSTLLPHNQLPPHDFHAMGSIGRSEPTPFSDLECFVIIKHQQDFPFFSRFAYQLELQIMALGDTPGLSSAPIKKGLYLDKNPKFFFPFQIGTPERLAELQQVDAYERDIYTYCASSSIYCNDHSLLEDYYSALEQTVGKPVRQARALALIKKLLDYKKEAFTIPPTQYPTINIKTHFMVPLYHIIDYLGFYHGIQKKNTLDILQELEENNHITPCTSLFLQEIAASIYLIRFRVECDSVIPSDEACWQATDRSSLPVLTEEEQKWLKQCYEKVLNPLYQRFNQEGSSLSNFEI